MTEINNMTPHRPGLVREKLAEAYAEIMNAHPELTFAVEFAKCRPFSDEAYALETRPFDGPPSARDLIFDHAQHGLALHNDTLRVRLVVDDLDHIDNALWFDTADVRVRDLVDEIVTYAWWCQIRLLKTLMPGDGVATVPFVYESDGVVFQVFDFRGSYGGRIAAWCWNPIGGWAYVLHPFDLNDKVDKDRTIEGRVPWQGLTVDEKRTATPDVDRFVQAAVAEVHDHTGPVRA